MNYHLYTNSDKVDARSRREVDVYFYPIRVARSRRCSLSLERERLLSSTMGFGSKKQKTIKKIEYGNIPAIVLGYPLPKKLDKRNQHPKRKIG